MIFIERKDYEFMLLSEKFCSKIDQYAQLLGLDTELLDGYKNESQLFTHVFLNKENYGSCAESFTRIKIENMRAAFSLLELQCRYSENYTFIIGRDLGIESEDYSFQAN